MVWGGGLLPLPLGPWAAQAQLGLNHTAAALHLAASHSALALRTALGLPGGSGHPPLNGTGDALQLSSLPFLGDVRALGTLLGVVPLPLLIFLSGLSIAAAMRPLPFRPYWVLCFWMTLMAGFGGGTLTNILLQEPILWCRSDFVLPVFAIAWWTIMYSPRDVGFVIYQRTVIKSLSRVSVAVLRARVILSRLELAVLKFSAHSVVAPLFFGTLGGCAGRLTVDLALHVFGPSIRPPELLHPGWLMRSAFLVSLWYMSCVHWWHLLPHDIAATIVASALVGHGLMEEMLGHPVDPTAPVAHLFHALTGIPDPVKMKVIPPPGVKARNGEYEKTKTS